MPFTPTHIVAVLPFAWVPRQRLPFSALVIGSQIPDVPLYAPQVLAIHERALHTFEGLVAGCLPLGLLGFIWFQGCVREPLVDLLPLPLRQRLYRFREPLLIPSYSFVTSVLVAVAIGAATHVFWDSFTHYNNWGYRLVPGMDRTVFAYGQYPLKLYKALQYGSTLVLLPPLILGYIWWLARLPRHDVPPSRLSDRQRWLWLALVLMLPALVAGAWSLYRCVVEPASLRAFAVLGVTTLGMLQFLAINAYACFYRLATKPPGQIG